MRSVGILSLLVGAAIVLGGARTQDGQALFTDQAAVTDNTFITASCFPGDTGFLDPSAEAADSGGDGDGFEVTPTNAFADGGTDPNYKAENIDGDGDRHRYYNYGISIKSACTIPGIEVRVDWWLANLGGTNTLSVEVSWDGGTSWTAAKTDTEDGATEHSVVLGGPADTWGHAWTVAELSNANFRVRLTTSCTGPPTPCNNEDYFLDWVPVKVSYGP